MERLGKMMSESRAHGCEVVEMSYGEMMKVIESAVSLIMEEVCSGNAGVKECLSQRGFNIGAVIDRIVYNDPYTIVFWADGTKTSVKAHDGDQYSRAVGLMMCWLKRDLGNTSAWLDMLRSAKALTADGDEPANEAVSVSIKANGKASESPLADGEVASKKRARRRAKARATKK